MLANDACAAQLNVRLSSCATFKIAVLNYYQGIVPLQEHGQVTHSLVTRSVHYSVAIGFILRWECSQGAVEKAAREGEHLLCTENQK